MPNAMIFIDKNRKVPLTLAQFELFDEVKQVHGMLFDRLESLMEIAEITMDKDLRKAIKAYIKNISKFEDRMSAIEIR